MGVRGFYIFTYGCQMNERDSESLSGFLKQIGYEEVDSPDEAGVILINTCCVRESAEQKILGKLGEMRKHKKSDAETIIGIGGCMVQQPGMAKKIRKHYPWVDLIFGTHNLPQLPMMLEACRQGQTFTEVLETEGQIFEDLPQRSVEGIKAHVTIMYGCNNFCSYCIVPYVRGRERSRRPEDIVKEIEGLVAQGIKEITLLGQNVNSYGKDLGSDVDFAYLMKLTNNIEGLLRIRFTTSHPKDFNVKLIQTMVECDKVCEHIHLPVQAGSNHVLKAMNRGYTREEYLEKISKIRSHLPKIAISTDIIVGFPGETDEDFEDTLQLVKEVRYDNAFTFLYSKRSGTPAAEMEDQVESEEKRKRFQFLLKQQNIISKEINDHLSGETVEVLVEGTSKKNSALFTGRTRTNKIVVFPGSPELIGKLIHVKINEIRTWTLIGEPV